MPPKIAATQCAPVARLLIPPNQGGGKVKAWLPPGTVGRGPRSQSFPIYHEIPKIARGMSINPQLRQTF